MSELHYSDANQLTEIQALDIQDNFVTSHQRLFGNPRQLIVGSKTQGAAVTVGVVLNLHPEVDFFARDLTPDDARVIV